MSRGNEYFTFLPEKCMVNWWEPKMDLWRIMLDMLIIPMHVLVIHRPSGPQKHYVSHIFKNMEWI